MGDPGGISVKTFSVWPSGISFRWNLTASELLP
jgi:hypothetical protein